MSLTVMQFFYSNGWREWEKKDIYHSYFLLQ
jgi:hypothetical protein